MLLEKGLLYYKLIGLLIVIRQKQQHLGSFPDIILSQFMLNCTPYLYIVDITTV